MRWRIWLFLVSKNEAKSEAPVIPSVLVACSEGGRFDRAHHFFDPPPYFLTPPCVF